MKTLIINGSPRKDRDTVSSVNFALSTAKCLLNNMGAEFTDFVCSHNTNVIPASKDNKAHDKIEKVVTDLLKGYY